MRVSEISLSLQAKEAIKTALAMTIAYGIALSMDWDKPYWAGFAVAFVSLTTVGQSMNKAALRLLGTFVAMAVALTLVALFSQERWLFMLCLSLYAGVCCYMMSGAKHAYFWQVCGFVCIVICMDAGPDSENAFNTAILRAQETGLGILVYSLVSIFLWPNRSSGAFKSAAADLALTQRQLYKTCLDLARGQGEAQEVQRLNTLQMQHKTRFDQLLDAAQTDSEDVWGSRRRWRGYQRHMAALMNSLERWRESITEIRAQELQRLLPGFEVFCGEIDRRFVSIADQLAGRACGSVARTVTLSLNTDVADQLSHFDGAAVMVFRDRMLHLERQTRAMLRAVVANGGPEHAAPLAEAAPMPSIPWLPDLDRLLNVVRYMTMLWLAFLAVIYIGDLPGGAGFVSMTGAIGIAIANMPQLPVAKLLLPVSGSVLFAAFAHIFVMPQLSDFIGLGLLIFSATFVICYLFAEPRQMLARAFGLAMFVTIASISNEQRYDFLSVANTALMFPAMFLIFAITAYIPFSPRPEHVALRLIKRFFRSSEYLVASMRWDRPEERSRPERWRQAFHAREVATLPNKFATWAPHIDKVALSGTTPQQVQVLLTRLQTLAYRIQQLIGERRDTPQAQTLVLKLLDDLRAWRLAIQGVLQQLAEDPGIGSRDVFRVRLDAVIERLEGKIKGILNEVGEGTISDRDAEHFYRLLGAFRSVSEALVDYAGHANNIDWSRWRLERFA